MTIICHVEETNYNLENIIYLTSADMSENLSALAGGYTTDIRTAQAMAWQGIWYGTWAASSPNEIRGWIADAYMA